MAPKVLVANRGESELFKLHIDASITHVSQRLVAIRIRRSVRELGWSTAAVYLPNDVTGRENVVCSDGELLEWLFSDMFCS